MAYKIAFKVKHDSDFYAKYFDAKEEKVKFKKLAVPLLKKHGIDGRFYICRLFGRCVKLVSLLGNVVNDESWRTWVGSRIAKLTHKSLL